MNCLGAPFKANVARLLLNVLCNRPIGLLWNILYVPLKEGHAGELLLVSFLDNAAKNTTKRGGSGEDNEAAVSADLVMTNRVWSKSNAWVLFRDKANNDVVSAVLTKEEAAGKDFFTREVQTRRRAKVKHQKKHGSVTELQLGRHKCT